MFAGSFAQSNDKQLRKATKSYIVELDDKPILHHVTPTKKNFSLTVNELQQKIDKAHRQVIATLDKKGISYKKKHEFMFAFNGFVLELEESKVKELSNIPGVKAVYEDKTFTVELSSSLPLVGASDVWKKEDASGHATTGKGMNVAVIDSGIDYKHPDLGEGYGPSYKVVAGYNFVENNDDPIDTHGHGTHVAGIIAANGELKGMAPDASLLAYKVIDNSGRGLTSHIMAAVEASVDPTHSHRADVINISLGLDDHVGRFVSVMTEYAVKSGVVVVTSAGNNGPTYGTVTHPGGADGVLTVGASTSGVTVPSMAMVSPEAYDFDVYRLDFSANPPDQSFQTELIDVGHGNVEDYKGTDVKGKTVLIQSTSQREFFEKAQLAEEMGAQAVIFYLSYYMPWSNWKGDFFNDEHAYGRFKYEPQHEFSILNHDFGRLKDLIAVEVTEQTATHLKGYMGENTVTLNISSQNLTDDIPDFSSRGETGDFLLGVNLVAPGVEIASTIPHSEDKSGYTRSNGTSMAAPHVAGAAALLKQLRPDWQPEDISSALVGTTVSLESYDPLTQGSGRLDIHAAAQTDITSSKHAISFGLADFSGEKISETETMTLKNHGDEPVELRLSAKPFKENNASLEINPTNLVIEPGETADVDIRVNADHFEQYEDIMGWVQIEDKKGDVNFRIPYYLAVRPLLMYATPDPAFGSTEIFIYSPVKQIKAPEVILESPDGENESYKALFDQGNWWRVPVKLRKNGTYIVSASTSVAERNGVVLKGVTMFEGEIYKEAAIPNEKWQPIGPNATGAWLNINPSDKQKMYAPNGNGFFIKNDKAGAWREIRNLPVAGGVIKKQLIDPVDANTWYVAINGSAEDLTYKGRILISKDAGKTWSVSGFPDYEINQLFLAENGVLISVLDDNRILFSRDKGNQWEEIHGDWGRYNDSELVGNLLLIGTTSGLYGIDFSKKDKVVELLFKSPSPLPWIQRVAGDDTVLLATTFSDGLFASFDNGKTWEQLNQEIGGLMQYLEVIDGHIYATKAGHFWMSPDYGKAWENWDTPVDSPPIEVNHSKTDETKYLSVNGGIFSTKDGQAYNRIGVPGADIYDLAFSKDKLIVGTQFDTYMKSHPDEDAIEQEWGMSGKEAHIGTTVTHIRALDSDPKTIYKIRLGPQSNFYLHKSEDGGGDWETIFSAGGSPHTLFIHPADEHQLYIPFSTTTSRGMMVSKDGGKSWETKRMDRTILTMVGDPDNPYRYWTGGADGLYETTDGGETFTKLQDIPISTMQMNPLDVNHIVFGGRDFYYTRDGGKTVEKGEYENLSLFVMDIVFNPVDPRVVYAATGSFYENNLRKGGRGILRSLDGGETWHSFNDGLGNKDVFSLAISDSASHLYAGTLGGSVYRLKLFDINEVEPASNQHVKPGEKVTISFKSNYNGGLARYIIKLPDGDLEADEIILSSGEYNMTEVEPGLYQGTWKAPADIEIDGALIEVELIDKDGNNLQQEAEGKIYVTLEEPDEDEPGGDSDDGGNSGDDEPGGDSDEDGSVGGDDGSDGDDDPDDGDEDGAGPGDDDEKGDGDKNKDDDDDTKDKGDKDGTDENQDGKDKNDSRKDGKKKGDKDKNGFSKDDEDKSGGNKSGLGNDKSKKGRDYKEGKHQGADKKGWQLPKTATNMFNWILIGGLTLLAGLTIVIVRRARVRTKK